ncbi:Fe(3+)-hydroxamate ABC transporter permease FhuB [Amorphus orientalis]|uniref:Iron complex transport system permease protein n=1 Tax=Amorphus orientalis TaxID=649198 RepID=A0AAE4ASR1_9HYPH|nr:Fe(3+)-hydroxamate ABC transporter permease FhuB [Amorphus orientalis]MDQ0315357.1 iron complex transport system permease protein [Amorphus orientalis]
MTTPIALRLPVIAALLFGPAAALTLIALGPELMRLGAPAGTGFDVDRLVLLYADLPRLATALLAGAGLGLSGVILQQVMRNPLASPTTLGLSAGAELALSIATLFAPGLLVFGRDLLALVGSALAGLAVFAIGARRNFAPVAIVLAGLIVSLYCKSLSTILILLHDRYLMSLFIWGSGSLHQQDWSIPLDLLPRLGLLAIAAALLIRPLGLLTLSDAQARSLGLKIALVRWGGVAIALALAAVITSSVGVIGFIGLVAPTVARLAGARRLGAQFVWAPVIGAGLLWLTDAVVSLAAGPLATFLPTGAVTALFGTPLLLLLLPRLKASDRREPLPSAPRPPNTARPPVVLGTVAVGLAVLFALAVMLGRGVDGGWVIASGDALSTVLPWRIPRVLAAIAAGAMLAVAGTILQRLTSNEMVSPEVIGVSAGATMGLGIALFVTAAPTLTVLLGSATLGAGLVLVAILAMGRKSGFAPERIVLTGIALLALLDAFIGLVSASGDPRALQLLSWMAGTTYGMDLSTALISLALMLVLAGATCLTARWLDIMPLGRSAARAIGVATSRVQAVMLLIAVALTAAGTLVVGPLSFVGLMAPHLARELGLRRALPQVVGAAIAGAAIMIVADFFGRNAGFPYELPAGLLSTLVGAPFLLLLLRRRQ